jgi:hypothetical protein
MNLQIDSWALRLEAELQERNHNLENEIYKYWRRNGRPLSVKERVFGALASLYGSLFVVFFSIGKNRLFGAALSVELVEA